MSSSHSAMASRMSGTSTIRQASHKKSAPERLRKPAPGGEARVEVGVGVTFPAAPELVAVSDIAVNVKATAVSTDTPGVKMKVEVALGDEVAVAIKVTVGVGVRVRRRMITVGRTTVGGDVTAGIEVGGTAVGGTLVVKGGRTEGCWAGDWAKTTS